MTDTEFLAILNTIDFPRRYWEMCDRFPLDIPVVNLASGRKEDILAAFEELGITPRYYRDGTFVCENERIGGVDWSAAFCKQRGGVELIFSEKAKGQHVGSNLCSLAYDAKRLADPTYERSQFSEPAPYPRPDHNGDPAKVKAIVKEFVLLVREIKAALRAHEALRESTPPPTGNS